MSNLPHAQWFGELFALNKITRTIATLKASDGGYIRLPQLLSVGANQTFELEFNVSSSQMATYFVANKEDTSGENRLVFSASGALHGCGVSAITPSNTSWLEDGKVNNVVFSRNESGSLSLKVNGNILLNTSAANGVPFKFDTLFSKWAGTTSSNNLNGSPLLFKCTVDGQLTHHYDFNVGKGTTIIPNLAQPLGSELVENGFITDINVLTHDKNFGIQTVEISENKTYLVSGVNNTGKTIDVCLGSETDVSEYRDVMVGDFELLVKATNGTKLFFRSKWNQTPVIGSISNLSVKEAPNWAEYINVADDNKELYTFDEHRNAWVGADFGIIQLPR